MTIDAPKPFCINCATGDIIPGEPTGAMETIGPYSTYVATPSKVAPGAEGKAIVYFYDAFGFNIKNAKVLPDILAEQAGMPVYVPDLFEGGGIAADGLGNPPQTAKEANESSLLAKASTVLRFAAAGPFFLKHRHSAKWAKIEEFLTTLKKEKSLTALGATGYCYGGKVCLYMNVRGLIDVTVANHPSLVSINADVANLKGATRFNLCEYDPIFPASMAKQAEEALAKRTDAPPHEFQMWPNTVHGSFARPKLGDELVKKAFEEATLATSGWFKKHLISSSSTSAAEPSEPQEAAAAPSTQAPVVV